jgi:hypothetical protein
MAGFHAGEKRLERFFVQWASVILKPSEINKTSKFRNLKTGTSKKRTINKWQTQALNTPGVKLRNGLRVCRACSVMNAATIGSDWNPKASRCTRWHS